MRPSFRQKFLLTGLLLSAAGGLQSCVVSRCARPRIYGYVYDARSRQPLAACQVGETATDARGYFELPEMRYHEFVVIALEAPPLHVDEPVQKPGYEPQQIQLHSSFGGSARKGAQHNADTLFLKPL